MIFTSIKAVSTRDCAITDSEIIGPSIQQFDKVEKREEYKYPTYPPLREWNKRRSLRYIQKCEQTSKHKHLLHNFEKQLLSHIEYLGHNTIYKPPEFTRTFLEYVILDVAFRNYYNAHPPTFPFIDDWFVSNALVYEMRDKCRCQWGMTPKHHARIYRNLINDALNEIGYCPTSLYLYLKSW